MTVLQEMFIWKRFFLYCRNVQMQWRKHNDSTVPFLKIWYDSKETNYSLFVVFWGRNLFLYFWMGVQFNSCDEIVDFKNILRSLLGIILLLILSEFKRINQLLFPLRSSTSVFHILNLLKINNKVSHFRASLWKNWNKFSGLI